MNGSPSSQTKSPRSRLTTRPNRRQILEAGALGMLGLGLPDLWQSLAAAEENPPLLGRRRAKACIFLFMWGGPSQLDTFDLKPNAPAEIRGDFKPVSTKTPGMQICEHFRHLPALSEKYALIRSLGHNDPAHLSSAHATLTGNLAPVVKSDATPPSPKDSPHIGSIVSRFLPAPKSLPSFVTMPWKALHPAAPGGQAPGQHGGWLGAANDPLLVTGDPNAANWKLPALRLQDGISPELLQNRYALLKKLDQKRSVMQQTSAVANLNNFQSRALDLLSSPVVQKAFDLGQEPSKTRDRYGRHIHGQCALLARRLVEHGVPLVSVNWHNDGRNFWDTHGNNFNRLKDDLIPPADQALSALLEDLDQRGMLDETIVAWVGEFGRRPTISKNNAGREHWPYCYSGLLAGGGIRGGAIYGASDKHATAPAKDPVSPHDFAATIYRALGVDPNALLFDREDRPHRVCLGTAIDELLT